MPHQLRSYFLSQFAKVGCFFAVYKFVSGPCFLCDAVYMTDIDDKASLIVSSSESQKVCQYRAVADTACQYWSAHFLSVSRLFDTLSQCIKII